MSKYAKDSKVNEYVVEAGKKISKPTQNKLAAFSVAKRPGWANARIFKHTFLVTANGDRVFQRRVEVTPK